MSAQILATKLYTPLSRPGSVPRPRLIDRLNAGTHGKLTLVSAPAGFGKTTLVAEWISSGNFQDAWLSLDDDDRDPVRFLAYFVAALQTIEPEIGADILKLLESPQPPPITSLLVPLINELAAISQDFVLVLDDYHALDSAEINAALAFLVDNQPPQMHLVIITREDPRLPLARLRARGQLAELRAADLRFTPDEAAEFLNEAMGLSLSPDDIAALEQRTEGWIAGLQLAAVSLRQEQDTHRFIQAFSGSHHFVLDYLMEEVLHHQPTKIQDFLLKTSIFDRMCASLCDAVLLDDAHVAADMLEYIRQANLFLIPLDNERRWYRYHHLFGDLLRKRLGQFTGIDINTMHIRASEWYEQRASPTDAVHHAFAAEDFERAADLIELAWPDMDGSFQTATWLRWIARLPDEIIRVRPVLSTDYAWSLLQRGELEATEVYLRNAERLLNEAEREMVVADEAQFQTLPATIASARAYLAQALGDVPATVRYGQQALDLLPENDYLRRGIAASLLGVAYYASGDLEMAHRTLAEGMADLQTAGNLLFAIRGTYILADIRLAQGRLQGAIRTYEQSLQLAAEQGESVLRGTADLYLRLSELYVEQNDLDAATELRLRSEELGEQKASPIWQYRLCLARARIKQAEGDLEGALDLLNEADRRYVRTPVPDIQPVGAMKARAWIMQGRLTEALAWVHEQGLSAADDLSFLHEFEHITLARVLIARHKNGVEGAMHEAVGLLERLLEAAEVGGRNGSMIEILIQQALAYKAQDDITPALAPLERALALAEPEGYVRTFVDEGTPMAYLLSQAIEHGIMPGYARTLLNILETTAGSTLPPESQALIEPLSERELEILALVAEGLSNHEISERLFISLSTVKGHNRNIFDKLYVKRRTEAVARARELGLIE